jgi:RimJ/RimL family protein N-acetyltransferase
MRFEKIGDSDTDTERLVNWFPRQTWPYHSERQVDADWVRRGVAAGKFFGSNTIAFWGLSDSAEPVAIGRVFDLEDTTPLIDLRVADDARRRGAGTAMLRWLTQSVFEMFPGTQRIGGYTRHDNLAMRRTFEKCGYVQEAYHRKSWSVEGGELADCVGFAILRADWQSGVTTPLLWTVLRQDDNGVVDRVLCVATQAEAQRIAADFEARGHKQTYWVEGPPSLAKLGCVLTSGMRNRRAGHQ